MNTYKAKSLVQEKTDFEIKNGSHVNRFISFEAIVRNFNEQYNITDKTIGYRVTEQGVELVYE